MLRAIANLVCVVLLSGACRAQWTVPGGVGKDVDALAIPKLVVGDPAPQIAIGRWVKGGPIEIERGKVYVIDFWATWCVPCMQSMPHANELAARYRDKGVTFIAVTAGDKNNTLEKVTDLVIAKGNGMDFAVGFDDERKTTAAFRDRARRGGIPVCFVIDRGGTLAWVGHPTQLDGPLEKIVGGTWDVSDARKAHAEEIEKHDLEIRLLREYDSAKKGERWEEAVLLAEEIRVLTPRLGFVMGDTVDFLRLKLKDAPRAAAYVRRAFSDFAADDGPALGRFARTFAEGKEIADMDLALACATRAVELTRDGNAWSQHSLAMVHWARGEREKAIEAEKEALSIAGDYARAKETMEKALREYESGK